MKRFHMLFSVCLLPGVALATILKVPSQYPTIQAGLNAAAAGDTVQVASGIYTENLVWPGTDGILLTSESGRDSTTIDGGALGSVLTFGSGLTRATIVDRRLASRTGAIVVHCPGRRLLARSEQR